MELRLRKVFIFSHLRCEILLRSLKETGGLDLDDQTIDLATETMMLCDFKKIEEIKLRKPLGSSDNAYNVAEDHLADLLRRCGYPEECVQLAGSIGHNGARDYFTAPYL